MSHTSEFELHGFLVEVDFEHTPEEPSTSNYPGCPEEFEITSLRIDGRNCINALHFGNVENELIDAIKKENLKYQEA